MSPDKVLKIAYKIINFLVEYQSPLNWKVSPIPLFFMFLCVSKKGEKMFLDSQPIGGGGSLLD